MKKDPMDKKKKKVGFAKRSLLEEYRACFDAVKVLDNSNVYAVILSECISNIFKEGMWQKVLTPYTLLLSGGDRTVVGNTMTLNGLTRATFGVLCGRVLINHFGADSTFALSGLIGIFGMAINIISLKNGSVLAMFVLNFVWAVYNGFWNSCLETEWARSVLKEKREDVNGARQILNKVSTAAGPVFSIALFTYFGNEWTVPLMASVMMVGTVFTLIPVLLCFFFSRTHEVCQEVELTEVKKLEFINTDAQPVQFECSLLRKADFSPNPEGFIKLTYPLKGTSKYGKLRVLTPDLRETNFILGKQQRAFFKEVNSENNICLVHFEDKSRQCVRAAIDSLLIFLGQDGSVKREVSTICFNLWPLLTAERPRGSIFTRAASKLFVRKGAEGRQPTRDDLQAGLLSDAEQGITFTASSSDNMNATAKVRTKQGSNIRLANVIVCCDVLNAIGSGMSLKFIDIFLIEDYGISPVVLLTLAFVQNLWSAYLTPIAKKSIGKMRTLGYSGSLAVTIIWTSSLFFMGMLCIPGMPFWIVAPSIVMMQALNSSTKAYNRAKLVNALPNNRVSNYMAWDSLNKANQGGVATFGALIVHIGGYRACFACTFGFMLLRILIYTGFAWLEGIKHQVPPSEGTGAENTDVEDVERFECVSGKEPEDTDLLDSSGVPASGQHFLLAPNAEEYEFDRRRSLVHDLQPAEEDITPHDRLHGDGLQSRTHGFRYHSSPATVIEED
mmetsp:Transcript_27198/g.63315  ORF Transcript_27198/g.63315 Transcript_27198/m.63315 type:complete len:728 (-) Transcript_27198:96-2279(-)